MFIVIASYNYPLFVLSSLLYRSLLLLQIQLQIRTTSELQFKTVNLFISFIPYKQTYMEIVSRRVYIIEWAYLTSDLKMFILKEDIFIFKTLFFESVFRLALCDIFLKMWVVHLKYKQNQIFIPSFPIHKFKEGKTRPY